VKVAVTYAIIF